MKKTELMYEALELKYKQEIAESKATMMIYFEDSVGIGEHPQHIEEMDKIVEKLADAEDRLATLQEFYKEMKSDDTEMV
jgi:hypothetical protein